MSPFRPVACIAAACSVVLVAGAVARADEPVAATLGEDGELRLVVDGTRFVIDAPVRWTPRDAWQVERVPGGDLSVIAETPDSGAATFTVVVAGERVVWSGFAGGVGLPDISIVAGQVVRTTPDPNLDQCAAIESWATRVGLDDDLRFAPLLEDGFETVTVATDAAGSGDGGQDDVAPALQDARATVRAGSSAPRPDLTALVDAAPETSLRLLPGQLVVLRSHAIAAATGVVIEGDGLASASILTDRGRRISLSGARSRIALDADERCVALVADEPTTVHRAQLRGGWPHDPARAAANWSGEVVEGTTAARTRIIADALRRLPAAATDEALLDAVRQTDDPAALNRFAIVADRLTDARELTVWAALAAHPAASPELVEQALGELDARPRAAAAALLDRLQNMAPDDSQRLAVATQLARLPVRGSVAPLLKLAVGAAEDDPAREPAISALGSLGPRLFGVVSGYLDHPSVSPEGRQAMLMALLRYRQPESGADGPDVSVISEPLSVLLASESLHTRLMVLEVATLFRITLDTSALHDRLDAATVDHEIALVIDAMLEGGLQDGGEQLLPEFSRHPEPTVRIAASSALASVVSDTTTPSPDAVAALQRLLAEDPWPESYGPAMVALVALDDQVARSTAASWLDDSGAGRVERSWATRALVAHPSNAPWKTLAGWLDDGTLSRSNRRALLRHWIEVTDDLTPLRDALTSMNPITTDDDEAWREAFVRTSLEGATARGADWLPALLTRLLERSLGHDEAARVVVIDAMAASADPSVAAALEAEAERSDEFGERAREALRRIGGGPIVVPEPMTDVPEL